MLVLYSKSVEETIKLGKEIATALQANDMLVLTGDLGAGKTHFTKGIACGLHINAEITSPTFPIVVEYADGILPLLHFDLYRLEDVSQLEDIAWYELIESQAVYLVEWGDKFPDELPDDYVQLDFSVDSNGMRKIAVLPQGLRGQELAETIARNPALINVSSVF